MNLQLGKIAGSVLHSNGGSFPRRSRGSVLRENPHQDVALPRLGRKELIRETQKILLQFSIKEAADDQDTTERAVEAQRNGESSISLQAAANMCRSNARARALFAPLFGFTGHYADPDFMEGLEKVMRGYLNQQLPPDDEGDEEAHADLFGGDA